MDLGSNFFYTYNFNKLACNINTSIILVLILGSIPTMPEIQHKFTVEIKVYTKRLSVIVLIEASMQSSIAEVCCEKDLMKKSLP